jgi:3-oxoacyl-[acyl-carrier-protein] synthase II
MRRRVVITGLGVISAIGQNPDEFWKSCLEGKTRIERIPDHWLHYGDFHSQILSPLPAIDYSKYGIGRIEEKQLDPTSLIAIACSFQALDSAGFEYTKLDQKRNTYSVSMLDKGRTGVFMGTGIGGLSTFASSYSHQLLTRHKETLAKASAQLADHPVGDILKQVQERMLFPRRFNPFAVAMTMPNACSANVGIKFNLYGSNNAYCAACASGTVAIGYGFKAVRSGELDLAFVGGVEYLRDDYGGVFGGFDTVRALAYNNDNPDKANRPFDQDRTGFLFSEGGGAVFVIENLEHAQNRGARIYAEILGYGETCDGFNIMMMEGSGAQIMRMLDLAFADAGISAADIDYINSHGTGTRLNDETETAVIEKVFGKTVLINSTKSLIGHTLGASGAIEVLVTTLSILHKTTHVCRNLDHPMKDLNFVTQVASYPIRTGLSQSFGFGGHNAVLVLREYQ